MGRKRTGRGVEGPSPLDEVCTIADVCKRWFYSRSSVLYAIDRGYIDARRIGRDWVVSIPSVEAHWGRPNRRTRSTAARKPALC